MTPPPVGEASLGSPSGGAGTTLSCLRGYPSKAPTTKKEISPAHSPPRGSSKGGFGLACRLGSCAPVGRVQDRRSWQRRPVRGRAPLALAHPPPVRLVGYNQYLFGTGGGSFSKIEFFRGLHPPRTPFSRPTSPAFQRSDTCPHLPPPSSLCDDTSPSGGGRVSPTGSVGSHQSATGARSPPPRGGCRLSATGGVSLLLYSFLPLPCPSQGFQRGSVSFPL